MKQNFIIDMLPVKRGKHWVVAVRNIDDQLDSEYSFSTKKDAKLFIDGWLAFLETHTRS